MAGFPFGFPVTDMPHGSSGARSHSTILPLVDAVSDPPSDRSLIIDTVSWFEKCELRLQLQDGCELVMQDIDHRALSTSFMHCGLVQASALVAPGSGVHRAAPRV